MTRWNKKGLVVVLVAGILLPALIGCGVGISLSARSTGTTESAGGLPGHPTTSTLSTAALCSPGIVTSRSGSLTGVLCIDPSSFDGVKTGTTVSASNPLLEVGIDKVTTRVGGK